MELILLFAGTACGVTALLGVMAVLIWLLVKGVGGNFRRSSGWDELARRFPALQPPPAPLHSGSIRLGNVFYRSGARLSPMPEGLYLAFSGAFKNPPLLIPWHEIKNPQPCSLYWQPARRMDIGQPALTQLTVRETHYQSIKPYLS